MALHSQAIDRALIIAAVAHEKQRRKGTSIPYIIHPLHVAVLLERCHAGEDVVVAGLLHDVLEDVDADDAEARASVARVVPELESAAARAEGFEAALSDHLRAAFGPRVLELVEAVTERKREGGEGRPWLDRKQESLARLAALMARDRDVALLKGADALHNVRSILADIRDGRANAWQRFNAEPSQTLWYYREVHRLVSSALPESLLARELGAAAAELGEFIEHDDRFSG